MTINETIPGWMSYEELVWLYDRARQMTSIVEVGCWMGRSTFALCSGCLGTVYAVDHFLGSPSERGADQREAMTEDIATLFLSHVGHFPNLRVCRMDSVEALRTVPLPVEMVFLDGEHTFEAVSRDILAWRPHCTTLLCGHDRNYPGVRQAREVLHTRDQDGPGSLWYVEL